MGLLTPQQIANRLGAARASSTLELEVVAHKADVDGARLEAAERGEIMLTATEGVRVAAVLGVSADELWAAPSVPNFRAEDGPDASDVAALERKVRQFRRVSALIGA